MHTHRRLSCVSRKQMKNAEEHGCEIDQRSEVAISAIYSSSVYVQRYLVCVCYFSDVAHQ